MNFLSILNHQIEGEECEKFHGKFIYFSQNYSLKHWDPYFDEANNLKIFILGRPVIDIDDWKGLNEGETSFISRRLLRDFVENDLNTFCLSLNGAFTVLILDFNKDSLVLITDKAGVSPVYQNGIQDINDFQISTNPDVLSKHVSCSLDAVSLAEFIKNGSIYHPNTLYKEVKQFDYGSYTKINFSDLSTDKCRYFRFKFEESSSFSELKKELKTAILHAIKKRTVKEYGKKAVFLSGGADSRSIACNSDTEIEAITLYDVKNFEVKITQKITSRLKIMQHLIFRGKDYYLDSLNMESKYTNSMSSVIHNHFIKLKENTTVLKYDSLLTGCYADWLFKGIGQNRKQVKLLGKKIPWYGLADFEYNFFGTNSDISKKYQDEVALRESKAIGSTDRSSFNEIEVRRVFPLSNEETSSTRLTLLRMFPWDPVFVDNDILSVYQKIPVKYKLNKQLFNAAVADLCGEIHDIPHANDKVRIGTHPYVYIALRVFQFIKKKFIKEEISNVYGDGSWINFDEYMKNNKKIKRKWKAVSKDVQQQIVEIIGYDPWNVELEILSKMDMYLFYNILTYSEWHDQEIGVK